MKTKTKVILVTVVVALLGFLTNAVGPLGVFWRPTPEAPDPTSLQFVFFGILLFIEAVAFGLGAAFLLFGYPLVKTHSSASNSLNRVTQFSIAWLLMNWWAHDSLHLHVGMNNLGKLLAIEYGFHFTIIVCTVIIVAFLFVNLRNRTAATTSA